MWAWLKRRKPAAAPVRAPPPATTELTLRDVPSLESAPISAPPESAEHVSRLEALITKNDGLDAVIERLDTARRRLAQTQLQVGSEKPDDEESP